MGRSQADKAETHEKIVRTAARRLREEGLLGVGVADLMKEAGLTVGGFYKHFDSRDELVAEALASIESAWEPAIADAKAKDVPDAKIFARLVDGYLSEEHRDAPGAGCVFAALSGDLARGGEKVRGVGTRKLLRGLELLAGLFRGPRAGARATAIVTYSALIGALSLARIATNDKDDALSREILTTVARAIKSWAAAR
jgi:TetR/AcrR family transcriptional regulator, transcriptional repressor for nem operon